MSASPGPADALDDEVSGTTASALRARVRGLQAEIQAAQQDREFAFTERNRVVQERESVRALCDRLRAERDEAVSKLGVVMREATDLRTYCKEVAHRHSQLRDKYESCRRRLQGANQRPSQAKSPAATAELTVAEEEVYEEICVLVVSSCARAVEHVTDDAPLLRLAAIGQSGWLLFMTVINVVYKYTSLPAGQQ